MQKKALSREDVYALQGWTIKQLRRQFWIAPTGSNRWSGPHRTLQHACTAVARKLSAEWTRRHKRLVEFHGAEA